MGNKPSSVTDSSIEIDSKPVVKISAADYDRYDYDRERIFQEFSFKLPSTKSEEIKKWVIKIYENDILLKEAEITKEEGNTSKDVIYTGGMNINDFFSNNKTVMFRVYFSWYDKTKYTKKEFFKIRIFLVTEKNIINTSEFSRDNAGLDYYKLNERIVFSQPKL